MMQPRSHDAGPRSLISNREENADLKLVKLAYEASASSGGGMLSLRLLHVDVGDDVGVKKGGHGIHLFDF